MGRAIKIHGPGPTIRVKQYPKIRVLNNYVLIEPEEQKVAGGIVLPDEARDSALKKTPRGTVVAVGPGGVLPSGERMPLSVKVGDKVLVDVSKCRGLTHEGEFYVLCMEDAIMGVRE